VSEPSPAGAITNDFVGQSATNTAPCCRATRFQCFRRRKKQTKCWIDLRFELLLAATQGFDIHADRAHPLVE